MAKIREIRDFIDGEILEEAEFTSSRPIVKKKKKVTYKVLIQSGCDFVIERREERKKAERLVILVSQKMYYIEFGENNLKRQVKSESLWAFLKDAPKKGLMLPEVSWIPVLYPRRQFVGELVKVLMDPVMADFIQKGLTFVPQCYLEHDLTIDAETRYFEMSGHYIWRSPKRNQEMMHNDEPVSPFYEADSYGLAGLGVGYNPDPFGGIPFGNGHVPYYGVPSNDFYAFRPPGAFRVSRKQKPVFMGNAVPGIGNPDPFANALDNPFGDPPQNGEPEPFGNPIGIENNDPDEDPFLYEYCSSAWKGVLYTCKMLSTTSPGLYRDMIRFLMKRNQCDLQTLFQEHLLIDNTPENRLLQGFHAFILIRSFFGPEWGARAMEKYLDSGMEEILPYEFLHKLLYKTSNLSNYHEEEYYKGLEPAWTFKAESFLSYLFDGAAREGFADDLTGYIARWDNALHFQQLLNGKVVEKYPENLASYEHKLAYKVRASMNELYQRMWDEITEESIKLEYESGDYKIISAKSKADLVEESTRQHNCVNTYEGNVLCGKCQIFFMRYSDPEKKDQSILTIEVLNGGKIGQVKGSCNNAPRMRELSFVQEWAEKKGLWFDRNESMVMNW